MYTVSDQLSLYVCEVSILAQLNTAHVQMCLYDCGTWGLAGKWSHIHSLKSG